jgi:hypothetical protein
MRGLMTYKIASTLFLLPAKTEEDVVVWKVLRQFFDTAGPTG